MKAVLFVLLLGAVLPANAQKGKVIDMPEFIYKDNDPGKYTWKQVCDLKGRILFTNAIVCTDSAIYSIGGFDTEVARREINELRNGHLRSWTTGYPGGGFINNISFALDSFLYVGGGLDSNQANYSEQDFWQLNMHTKAWTRLKNLPFYYRGFETVFQDAHGIWLLVPELSGPDLKTVKAQLLRYDPAADEWTRVTTANEPPLVRAPAAFKIEDAVFVFSQNLGTGGADPVNTLYKLNLTDGVWSTGAAFPGAGRQLAFGASDGHYGYIGGGAIGTSAINGRDVYRYDPVADSWARCSDLPSGLRWAKAWSFNGELYVGFGICNPGQKAGIWKLRPRK